MAGTSKSRPVERHISAGGVIFRRDHARVDVALISVGPVERWQLPKGTVDVGEDNATAAAREVREETGLTGRLLQPIDSIDYWFSAYNRPTVRVHKFVHFFLFEYERGDTRDHDNEVNEARWVEISAAMPMLAFDSERAILASAQRLIRAFEQNP